jgi:hypothetical protein
MTFTQFIEEVDTIMSLIIPVYTGNHLTVKGFILLARLKGLITVEEKDALLQFMNKQLVRDTMNTILAKEPVIF